MRARVAPGLGTCKENCGVSSLFLVSEQEEGKREEEAGAGRTGEGREWIMKEKKKNPSNSAAEGESTAQSSKDESRTAFLCGTSSREVLLKRKETPSSWKGTGAAGWGGAPRRVPRVQRPPWPEVLTPGSCSLWPHRPTRDGLLPPPPGA